MKFQEIISRLTGFSTPIFGVQWNPPESQRALARRAIAFLEDRRVLFVPSEMESPDHCVQSILRIREFLTHELGGLDADQPLAQSLRAMRAACRKCLATVEADDRRIIQFGAHHNHYASWIFNGAIGELRGVFGIHIATLAALCLFMLASVGSMVLTGGERAFGPSEARIVFATAFAISLISYAVVALVRANGNDADNSDESNSIALFRTRTVLLGVAALIPQTTLVFAWLLLALAILCLNVHYGRRSYGPGYLCSYGSGPHGKAK